VQQQQLPKNTVKNIFCLLISAKAKSWLKKSIFSQSVGGCLPGFSFALIEGSQNYQMQNKTITVSAEMASAQGTGSLHCNL
jgi:hypothetical protein